ncbi:MAG TPA: proline--tRNA ligase [Thermoanaerobaculia bacterium]|nr:proline--tRNA ligase [Thermoanaerobaculia bacterium]
MRWSQYYLFTTREVPSDAEVVSHQLMVRAGMIKKVAAGIYTYLPFGWRSIRKLEAIVRRELDAAGAVELQMPVVQPAELWRETRRWEQYGHLLLRIQDRNEREFCFAPTAEEVITDIVRKEVSSYRQLPFNLYQIGVKFRDEIRPRFGLMRGREFLMKDAYSFHASDESLDETYRAMERAYRRIFEACELEYTVVEAESGEIGGSASNEFMVLAETGEDAVVRDPATGYAANVEKAVCGPLEAGPALEAGALEEVATPGKHTVDEVAEFLGVDPRQIVKTLLYETDAGPAAVLVRGDREVNEVKLKNVLGAEWLELAGEETVRRLTGAPPGFAGPVGLPEEVRLVADRSIEGVRGFVCGANKADAHLVGAQLGRDLRLSSFHDVLLVRGGDPSPRGEGALEAFRGIEVGHIFKLGTKYSEAMGCTYADETGAEHPMIMGCYGLGIGRTVAAAIEQNFDEAGIVWPRPLAPFEVLVLELNPKGEAEVTAEAERLHDELLERGVDVLWDDRDERPGVKFNDADLLGVPVRIVVGARGLAEGKVELSHRRDREKVQVAKGEAVAKALELLEA